MRKLLTMLTMAVTMTILLVMTASATELKTAIGIVDSNGLRLRAKPTTDAEILTSASYGDSVVVIRQSGDWYLVDYNREIGYMSADHLTLKDRENIDLGKGTVNAGSVNMRSTPSSDGDLVMQLPAGATPKIIGFNCTWYKVEYNGSVGYIRSDLLDLTEAPASNSTGVSSVASQLLTYAQTKLGIPYVWGGTSNYGFDCSGFTQYVFKQFGISINRTANQQQSNGYRVTDLAPGDLVFFGSGSYANHVGIYMGDNQFIHSAGSGVKITSLSENYYAVRYIGASRVL